MMMMAWTLSPLSILAANNDNNYKGVIGLTDTTALTLKPALQRLAGQLLQGKQGSIVAIEPATGRILCLYSHDKVDDGVNRAIAKTYSPGSTFKTAQTTASTSAVILIVHRSPWYRPSDRAATLTSVRLSRR